MNVLFATDGSADARAAGDLLRQLEWAPEDRLRVVAVAPPANRFTGKVESGLEECRKVIEQERYRMAEEVVSEAARGLEDRFTDPETSVYAGPPAKEILDAAEEMSADLIATGGRGRNALPDWILGSVSRAVLERARCSVLVVHPGERPLRNVLLAYDGTRESEAALGWVKRLRWPTDARVRVECVVEQIPLPVISSDQVIPVEFYRITENLEEQRKREAGQKSGRACGQLRALGLAAVEECVRTGKAVEEIVDVATGWPADLVVLGAHTNQSWLHDMLGNTARGVIRNVRGAILLARSRPGG
jgi:nucleotide-binding universal stress UspA family protein